MEQQNFSEDIFKIMTREMGEIGVHIVKNQCYENGILYSHITWEDVPKLSKAISEAMLSFGEDKAGRISREIRGLVDLDNLLQKEKNPLVRAKMYSQLGDSSAITGEINLAMKYYESAKECAAGIEPAVEEIDKRIRMLASRKGI